RSLDLAIIRIEGEDLPALELGDSDELKQGQPVVAIGHPQKLRYSVVSGVLSGRREIDERPMLQLAIPIEQGNSGGPLLDMHGRVQGLLTLKSLVTANLGYAVPINELKPLIEDPNPVSMQRWLELGALDDAEWTTLFGSRWTERAGRIFVEGEGQGIGRRSLALSKREVPEAPFELAVDVRLQDDSGAAGLVFHSDGGDLHYGFYPSNGNLRLSRFDGPDVFQWQVLEQAAGDHYRPGEWNTLKVSVADGKIACYVNDQRVIESTDAVYTGGQVGLAQFRSTLAEFRRFRVAKEIPSDRPDEETTAAILDRVAEIDVSRPPTKLLIGDLAPHGEQAALVLRERAALLERRAERLRELAADVHRRNVTSELAAELVKPDAEIDLLKAALLIARLDDDEIDVAAYLRQVERMVAELKKALPADADDAARLESLDQYLFDELGFHGARHDYYSRENSYLHQVLDERTGLPITLSVLYVELAARLGLKVVGVPLPGHFVVRHEPAEGEGVLIDVFDRGRRLTVEDAAEKVRS
ncbi:MAG: transglutaminase family protein, partial [Planctomycetaceae bacterium]